MYVAARNHTTHVNFDQDSEVGIFDVFLLLLRPLKSPVVPCLLRWTDSNQY